jgi:hypothetical protein
VVANGGATAHAASSASTAASSASRAANRTPVGRHHPGQRRLIEDLLGDPRPVRQRPPAPPRQIRPWRISTAVNRCCIRLRSSKTSRRARTRSRTASSAGVGTRIAVSSPARCNRANRIASRLSVFTRSEDPFGINDGATGAPPRFRIGDPIRSLPEWRTMNAGETSEIQP